MNDFVSLRQRDFAPISSEPSTRLQFVAWYFSLTGGLGIVGVCVALLLSTVGGFGLNLFSSLVLAGIGGTIAAGLLWTGRALRQRSKSGWYAGLITLAAPLVSAFAGKPLETWTLVVSAVGLGLLASVRRELE